MIKKIRETPISQISYVFKEKHNFHLQNKSMNKST